jgi:NOL1/NOP2/fmu family ribosome biogenesis protein
MFRKSKPARAEWQPGRVKTDALRQGTLLDAAARLVRPGGVLVYSTCTFEPEENEANIARFVQRHPAFEIDAIEQKPGFAPGRPEWAAGNPALGKTVRLWPHLSVGEGHFVARLKKDSNHRDTGTTEINGNFCKVGACVTKLFHQFCAEHLTQIPAGQLFQAGQDLYLAPPGVPDLRGLRVVRWGWWVGTLKSQVFVPGHALAMGLTPADVRQSLDFAPDDARLIAYLRGDSLRVPGEPGWVLVTVDSLALGWGKRTSDIVKNRRPSGLAQTVWE